jgi:hypothetical protein
VLDRVIRNNGVELIICKRIGKRAEIVNDVSSGFGVVVEADRPGVLFAPQPTSRIFIDKNVAQGQTRAVARVQESSPPSEGGWHPLSEGEADDGVVNQPRG